MKFTALYRTGELDVHAIAMSSCVLSTGIGTGTPDRSVPVPAPAPGPAVPTLAADGRTENTSGPTRTRHATQAQRLWTDAANSAWRLGTNFCTVRLFAQISSASVTEL